MNNDLQLDCSALPETQAFSQNIDLTQNLDGWGSLVPISEDNLKLQVLTEDCYTVGRSPECNICLGHLTISSPLHTGISKTHFKLIKSPLDGSNVVYLEDLSSNGTFINGIKVGRNRRVILTSTDEISLAVKSYKVFLFIDKRRLIEGWLTPDLRTNFLVLKHLGTGGFGDVKLVVDKVTLLKYAMKKVGLNREKEISVFNEVNILKKLKHPCIIQFENIYETSEAVYIILEYVSGGNLLDRIQTRTKILENECKVIFYQLILGVKYLHEAGIVHRDLKPENVLLKVGVKANDITVKITDFGLSKILHSATNLRTTCGTLTYTAPEVLNSYFENYSKKVDIWSLGVILFYCLSGSPPFKSNDPKDLPKLIVRGAYRMEPREWQLISKNAVNLVKSMLKVNPTNRIDTNAIMQHSWFQDNVIKGRIQRIVGDKFIYVNGSDDSDDTDFKECHLKIKRIKKD